MRSRTAGVMLTLAQLFQVIGPLAIGGLSDTLGAISPNALVIAIVSLVVVMGALGSIVLRATEASFTRLVAQVNGEAAA
jgi:hypothetical protein